MKEMYELSTDILRQADDFSETYRRCKCSVNWHEDEFGRMCAHTVNIPAIVNAAFACELYLKSLINEPVEGHNLKTLYESLDNMTQNTIETFADKMFDDYNKSYNFNSCLKNAAKVFVDWRYLYEKDYTEVCAGNSISELLIFFDFFIDILSKVAHEK